ncbi:Inositol-1,4,5-trisphosphate 5-phosphatase 1 [Taphrina deformans PYCC 5710]|uniref:phosphoinositide 5-phosphatase n=1 Tax=Taphrina deformans (strain PYCC 5710 / ATCC 11124 / CBS 356.35 / IMI 108563 / JCM 9778 / NBRC 8474) TaxID=1097556 RepID=R4XFI4_TAPDE|nr:Inositol-1,4,5-trisphosphate 5-phosphatase 1 [Taphrina deformans PYCC 5710]|eukprot:CCG82087.1 Inositol-1,4,5-trisphosphate 5-phosphatase 1 [Taphrina deformans PYCC 5710]
MSSVLQIYKRDNPRSFAVSNSAWTLFLQGDPASKSRSLAEFVSTGEFDISSYRLLKLQKIYGTLGLICLNDHVFVGVVSGCSQVAKLGNGATVQRIHAVEFYCLDSDIYDTRFTDVSGNTVEPGHEDIYDATERLPEYEHPCDELRRLLSSGSFYFSSDHDLSLNLQARSRSDYDPDVLDRQFLWNDYLISSLELMRSNMSPERKDALDSGRFLTSIIRGFAETMNVTIGSGIPGQLSIISRLSSKRAGTRFNARGIDDDGNVANFVETETILNTNTWTSSFCQVRGSVPLFWEQISAGFMGQHKVEITRSPSATQAAFEKHFESLLEKYGDGIHVVNLLGTASNEATLTGLYRDAIRSSDFGQAIRSTEFDFHHEVKNGYESAATIKPSLRNSANQYGFYLHVDKGIQLTQTGVFRTNCLDCLDRTNMIQNIISQAALENVLRSLTIHPSSGLWERHGTLWADNGDALSRIYAGTGALKTSFTRKGKMSFAGALADATKSAARMYINNFQDKGKQEVIDIMLGRLVNQKNVVLFDPIADWVNSEAAKRKLEWSSSETLYMFAGTYNLNGKEGEEPLDDWLRPSDMQKEPDIYAIGFQEIVELTPAQIVSADPVKVRNWADKVLKCLDPKNNDRYVLLRTGQLVGAALLIFVKSKCLKDIKLVEGAQKKTGLKGMSGNKGGVAIRMEYGATRLCFINSHFAAGHSNYAERNQDFGTILNGIRFQRGRNISDHHDTVVWVGDFNYRISSHIEDVKSSIALQDWGSLYSADQLNKEMIKGNVFRFFHEKEITFAPTYKFDNGTDEYDSSDKQRIPAWTDRILKKGSGIRQLLYNSAPTLKFSDHKPVYATYEVDVQIVDEVKKSAIERELYVKKKIALEDSVSFSEQDLESVVGKDCTSKLSDIDYSTTDVIVPSASSSERKWWLDHHRSSRTELDTPVGAKLNPNRPINPWKSNGEPNFINKDRPVPARKPVMPGAFPFSVPPPLPKRVGTTSSSDESVAAPALPSRAKVVPSLQSGNVSSTGAPVPPPARRTNGRSTPSSTGEAAAKTTIKARVHKEEVDHLNDTDANDDSDLSGYKSLA